MVAREVKLLFRHGVGELAQDFRRGQNRFFLRFARHAHAHGEHASAQIRRRAGIDRIDKPLLFAQAAEESRRRGAAEHRGYQLAGEAAVRPERGRGEADNYLILLRLFVEDMHSGAKIRLGQNGYCAFVCGRREIMFAQRDYLIPLEFAAEAGHCRRGRIESVHMRSQHIGSH